MKRCVTTALALALGVAACEPSGTSTASGPLASLASAGAGSLGYLGQAYGSYAYVASEEGFVRAGKSALSTLGCEATLGQRSGNTVTAVDAPPVVSTGVASTSVEAASVAGGSGTRATSEVHSVSLLGGLITADLVRATAWAGDASGGFGVSDSGSALVNLRISGQLLLLAVVSPNTRVELTGVGYVVLNEQSSSVTDRSAELTVNMIHVFVAEQNQLGIPWSTNVYVGHAESSTLLRAGTLDGGAYGSEVTGSVVRMGRSAVNYMPCLGTDGQLRTSDVGSVSLSGVFALGGVATDVRGSVAPALAEGQTGSTITGVSILDGLIRADAVRAQAEAQTDGSTAAFSDEGSRFLNLSVAGHAEISADVGPNTTVQLAGLGTLWLRRVVRTSSSIEVRMIEIVVQVTNSQNLPVGTEIRVAVAEASVH